MLGEGVWRLGSGRGGLEAEFTDLVDSDRKEGEVFVMGGLLCGEDEGQGSGFLRRWGFNGFLGRFWGGMVVCVGGNSGGGCCGVVWVKAGYSGWFQGWLPTVEGWSVLLSVG